MRNLRSLILAFALMLMAPAGFAAPGGTPSDAPQKPPAIRFQTFQTGAQEWLTSTTVPGHGRALIFSTCPVPSDEDVEILVFACPNGNTAEQTVGDTDTSGTRWRYGIQHIAAQWRYGLANSAGTTTQPAIHKALVCVEAPGLSWPTQVRSATAQTNLNFLEALRQTVSPAARYKTLAAHSGGGALLHLTIAAQTTPTLSQPLDTAETLAFLDANYAFQHAIHGKPLAQWLRRSETNRLVSLTYDDRDIQLNGKRIIGPTGGTLRANLRMLDSLTSAGLKFTQTADELSTRAITLDGRVRLETLSNPQNKILHTVLVEKNGLQHALEPHNKSRVWMTDARYRDYIRPLPKN